MKKMLNSILTCQVDDNKKAQKSILSFFYKAFDYKVDSSNEERYAEPLSHVEGH